ncbi:hypothetical protein XELAEV_18025249mg [Xenopus laevis]|uniref:STIL N-terminal domain-containing protein n=1 Tax=Xenopus laevis TaxID=8355 RepID=A0A974CZ54_XENLA|nr:hypothetical protein XELAEV_18025249mg [Xenopus laevis]
MSNRILPVNFPPSNCALWDPPPMGDTAGLHFSYYRNPILLVLGKALWLSSRLAKTGRKPFSCFLLGTFSIDEGDELCDLLKYSTQFKEKTDGGGSKVPTAQLPGDFVIPCTIGIGNGSNNVIVHNPEDFTSSFMSLQSHLHCKKALDLSKLLTMRAHITYTENMDNLHFDLHWAAVTIANTFESTPIKPVPIIPTALARNLGSHNNIAHLQGTHKSGFRQSPLPNKLSTSDHGSGVEDEDFSPRPSPRPHPSVQQIQCLLEAQAAESEPSKANFPNNSKQKQAEFVSTEHEIKTSVSIAVSTGSSLFWNPHCPEKDKSVDKQDDSAFCNEFSVAVNTEDASQTTVTSSLGQWTPEIDSGVSIVPPEKFYQDLLSLPTENDDRNVLKATLKQLKNLGVNIDVNTSELKATKADTADSASVLACINLDAVIPRLNYMSFWNIGLSGFVTNGSQLSLSHANKSKQTDSISYNSLLPGTTTEKSIVWLSLISPSNMSFATKKYMKRHGLIESSNSSMDEPDLQNAISFAITPLPIDPIIENKRLFFNDSCKDDNFVTCEAQKRKSADVVSAIGWAHHPVTNKLRNITDEISGKFINVSPLQEDKPVHFLKDLKTKTKLSTGKAQHPEKENMKNMMASLEK